MNHKSFSSGIRGNRSLPSEWLRSAAIALGVLCLVAARPCRSQAAGGTPIPIKVVSDSQLLVRLDANGASFDPVTAAIVEDITPCVLPDPKGPDYACTADESNGLQSAHKPARMAQPVKGNRNGMYLLEFSPGFFATSRLYRLTLQQTDPKGVVANTSVNVDTSPSIAVALADLGSPGATLFRLTSTLGFVESFPQPSGVSHKDLTVAKPVDCGGAGSEPGVTPITITGTDDSKKAITVSGWRMPLTELSGGLSAANTTQTGSIALCLNLRPSTTNFTPDASLISSALAGIESPLGAVTWTVPQGTQLSASAAAPATGASSIGQPSPAAKSAANFYANLTLAAATGAKLAWGLDGKISELNQPVFGSPKWRVIWLSATANTGGNTANIKGQVYTDTIDWTLPFTYVTSHGGKPRFELIGSLAPDYETDIEFDRKNFLTAGDLVWNFGKLYQPQEKRTVHPSHALIKYPDPSISRFGYVLQFHTGFEAGGALMDTVEKAPSGTAKITVPSYSICRALPQITGNIQWIPARRLGLFTFDDTIEGRYLFATENTVEQHPIPAMGNQAATVGLRLRPLDGWRAYNTLISTWNPKSTAHFGITVTYDDGFNAPKFTRVNSVTAGITIAY